MKILPVGADLFHADDGQTFTKLKVAFRNTANSPESIYKVNKKTAHPSPEPYPTNSPKI